MREALERKAGITLVALVVTIIVLIILAGVSISLVLGQNGIFTKAKLAKLDYANATEEEKDTLNEIESFIINEVEKDEETQLKIGDYVNYPVYYDNVSVTNSSNKEKWILKDEYVGWRILSIDEENKTVKLVSTGLPLNYYHKNINAASIENLITKFLDTPIASDVLYNFHDCGFKTSQNGEKITNINDVKSLFMNDFTQVFTEPETYTDNGSIYQYTIGNPKVQAMTKEDFDTIYGQVTEHLTCIENVHDLIPIYSTNGDIVPYYIVKGNSDGIGIYGIDKNEDGILMVDGTCCYGELGVRPVVCLKPNVKFKKAQNKINNTTTWDIEIQ